MQRPRNRQARGGAQNDRGRSRGRGRGRGGGTSRHFDDRGPSNVPNINQVVPGGFVSIVLKIDQPTGREVQGVVADVLTSGNHPRGIKVRLVDGRVGRVQRMATEAEARDGSAGLSELGRNGESGIGRIGNAAPPAGRVRYRDVREEEGVEEVPASGYSLADFLPAGHPLLEEGTQQESPSVETPAQETPTQVCPVCGEFEGDEIAVSHHVNTHFD